MILAHRIKLDPNNKQAGHLQQCCGVSRFAYNWALARWNSYYTAGLKVNANQLDKDYNKCKKTLFPWAYDVTKCAGQNAIKKNLKSAFTRFFNKKGSYPQFKKRGMHDSFTVNNDTFAIFHKVVKLPKIGKIRMTEDLRYHGKILSGTVSKDASGWYISITVDLGDSYHLPKATGSVGLDLGIKTAVVTSEGQLFDAPKPLKRFTRTLKRQQRRLSKKVKGSNNRAKDRIALAKTHLRISRIRKDWINKVTTQICNENQIVCMEDLSVSNMMKNHCLARAISDIGWYEIYRQIKYKTTLRFGFVVKISRWFPSTKTCSSCGNIQDMTLSDRIYTCKACSFTCDRDINAAININTVGLTELKACGEVSSGVAPSGRDETNLCEAGTIHRGLNTLNKK